MKLNLQEFAAIRKKDCPKYGGNQVFYQMYQKYDSFVINI